MNKSWGYNEDDGEFKSTKQLVHYLVRAAGINGNLLLNVGPPPTGKFQPEVIKSLKEIGEWNKTFGESVFKTRGGPMQEQAWGVMTQGKEGSKTYLHILNKPESLILEVPVNGNVSAVKLFNNNVEVPFEMGENLQIDLTNLELDAIDTILIIEKEGELKVVNK